MENVAAQHYIAASQGGCTRHHAILSPISSHTKGGSFGNHFLRSTASLLRQAGAQGIMPFCLPLLHIPKRIPTEGNLRHSRIWRARKDLVRKSCIVAKQRGPRASPALSGASSSKGILRSAGSSRIEQVARPMKLSKLA